MSANLLSGSSDFTIYMFDAFSIASQVTASVSKL